MNLFDPFCFLLGYNIYCGKIIITSNRWGFGVLGFWGFGEEMNK